VDLPCLYEPRCPECQGDVTIPGQGYYGVVGGEYQRTTAPVRRLSRTAIDRWRQTAADRLLYTLEMVEPGRLGESPLLFRGSIFCDDAQEAVLRRWLPQVKGIGGGRSRGLGDVEVQVLGEADEAFPELGRRLAEFDGAVRKEWNFYERVAGVPPLSGDVHFFSVDLLAPAFLTNRGLPATRPATVDLGLPEGSVRLWRAMSRQSVVGGWHMGGRLPRRTALATAMGSVFLYRCEGLSFGELESALQKLELEGLGEERARGFGQVLISSPIHYQAEVTL
jgi:CRISPR-associated protein Csx10